MLQKQEGQLFSLNDLFFQITRSVRASLSGGFVSDHQHKGDAGLGHGQADPPMFGGPRGRWRRRGGGDHCVLEVKSGRGDGWSSICGSGDLIVTCA